MWRDAGPGGGGPSPADRQGRALGATPPGGRRARALLLGWLVSFLASTPARASDCETWGHLAVTVVDRPRQSWIVFGALRGRHLFREAYDRRGGASVRVLAGRRMTFTAGFLARGVRSSGDELRREYWLFGGPGLTVWQGWLTTRAALQAERHLVVGRADFNRYRWRLDAERRRRGVSPFLLEEATVLKGAVVRWRTRAGGRYRFRSGSLLELAYQFESIRRGVAWRPRHAVSVRFNLRLAAEEP